MSRSLTLRRLVARGDLDPGANLPPVRQLAGDLGVSLNTVARAYRLLEHEGFIVIRDRAGATVAAPAAEVEYPRRAQLVDQLRATLARLRQVGLSREELRTMMSNEVDALDRGKEPR